MPKSKEDARQRRKFSIRKRISGTVERPRLSVFRSARHIYAQVIDDVSGKTLTCASTLEKELSPVSEKLKKMDKAKKVGALIAKKCLELKIEKVVFDRNGYLYHGRIAALAKGARDAGLKF